MFIYNYIQGGRPEEDVIEKSIGAFGKYHYWLCFLVFLSKVPMSMHQMAIIFLAPKVSFVCDGEPNKCPCDNPEYDTTIFTNSIIMQFHLICNKKWLISFAQSTFQFGTLLGSIFFGIASDRYGRRMPFVVAGAMEFISGLAASYVPTYTGFVICRFFCGMAVGGTMVIGFVFLSEYTGAKHRTVLASIYQVPSTLGHLITSGVGYCFRNYHDFQIAISLPAVAMLSYICLLPETPRWLIAAKRNEDAIELMERVARINDLPANNIRADVLASAAILDKQHIRKGHLTDLFKTPNIRKRILAMAYNWFACSYCFYGVSQYISYLSGNIFLNVATSATCTTLGSFLSICLLLKAGRRTVVVTCHLICVVCLTILAVVPNGIVSVVCACVGIVTEFMVFIVVYLYTTELFPTVVRNLAMGFSSMTARIGSMIAPFVIELGVVKPWLPPLLFALLPALALFITFVLPETKNCKLTTTLQEGEQFGTKKENHTPEK